MDITRKLTKALIELYWERKCLWQVNSEDYKKKDLKKKSYFEIVAFLRRNGVKDADRKLVRDKIQNLRRAMRKEKKKIDDSGGTYSPTLWYYDLLSFVNDQYEETPKTSNSNIKDLDDDFDSNADSLDEDNKEPSKKPINSAGTEANKCPAAPDNLVPRPDEFEALGINVGAKVKRMNATQQVYAELLIQKVLARGLLGQLNDTTELVELVPDNGAIVRLGPVMPSEDAYRRATSDSFVNRSD